MNGIPIKPIQCTGDAMSIIGSRRLLKQLGFVSVRSSILTENEPRGDA
jgi:hypothetical protein